MVALVDSLYGQELGEGMEWGVMETDRDYSYLM